MIFCALTIPWALEEKSGNTMIRKIDAVIDVVFDHADNAEFTTFFCLRDMIRVFSPEIVYLIDESGEVIF